MDPAGGTEAQLATITSDAAQRLETCPVDAVPINMSHHTPHSRVSRQALKKSTTGAGHSNDSSYRLNIAGLKLSWKWVSLPFS